MNKSVCISFLLLLVLFANADEKYSTRYDNIDYEQILSSERLLKNYVYCLLDNGPCSPDGKELRDVLHEALETECEKCNDHQKKMSKKIIQFLIENHKDWWNQLADKYDPDYTSKQKFEEEWEKEKHHLDG